MIDAAPGCPADVRAAQTELAVQYVDLEGSVHAGVIEIHEAAAADLTAFFEHAVDMGFAIERVVRASAYGFDDEALMSANATSGFNYRTIAGTDTLSWHGRGLAFDVNTRLNPYTRGDGVVRPDGAVWRPGTPGTLDGEHPLVVLMEGKGWEWGGRWDRPDYQHFQRSGLQ